MKKRYLISALGVCLCLTLSLFGCGGGGGGGSSSSGGATPSAPASPPPSNPPASSISKVLSSATILPTAGGLIQVKSSDSQLNGASLDIPAKAVSKNTTISLGTVDTVPAESPFGHEPVGKLFGIDPQGLAFSQDVTLTLPIPPGDKDRDYYIGYWNDTTKKWENLGGKVQGDFISTTIKHLSSYGVFVGRKSDINMVNQGADLMRITYESGPAPPPDWDPYQPFPDYPALPPYYWKEIKRGETFQVTLAPGRYHFYISYIQPQPGVKNDLYFTVPVLTSGADDSQTDQTITLTETGATSTNPETNASIDFPGRNIVPGTNIRPVIGGTAIVPAGVNVVDRVGGWVPQNPPDPASPTSSRLVNVGPITIPQLKTGVTLTAKATDQEGHDLYPYWTWSHWDGGNFTFYDAIYSGQTINQVYLPANPIIPGVHRVSLTVYDQYGLFDEVTWFITISPTTPPIVKGIADDFFIDFGRQDYWRRPTAPQPWPDLLPQFTQAAPPGGIAIPPPAGITTLPFGNLCSYVDTNGDSILDTTFFRTLPTVPLGHVNPSQYPDGATCVFAIIGDPDGDELCGGFRLPEPIFGRGNFYAAVPVPNSGQGGGLIPLCDNPPQNPQRYVSDILPGGLLAGSLIDTYEKMDAYNATVSYLANRGLLPVAPPAGFLSVLASFPQIQPLPAWPANPPAVTRGAQALPVIWEAPDDPDVKGETHSCVGHRFQLSYDPLCSIPGGGTYNLRTWVEKFPSDEQGDYAVVAVPDANSVFGGNFTLASITPNPADPGPFQGVTVTACIQPVTIDVSLDFSIVGTDKYTKQQTVKTNDKGCADFYIPGGAEGVVDVVTVKVGSVSGEVTYTF